MQQVKNGHKGVCIIEKAPVEGYENEPYKRSRVWQEL